ncbi:MAG: hypothetical protein QW816_01125 [Desulfurococcaceae archaeon]
MFSAGKHVKILQRLIMILVVVFTFILLIHLSGFNHYFSYVILLISILLVLVNPHFLTSFELKTRNLMAANLLIAGRGLSSDNIKLLQLILQTSVAITLLVTGFTITYFLFNKLELLLLLTTLACFTITVFLYYMPVILIKSWSAQRKTAVEIELPYLLILFRVLSSLRLPIYDIFSVIEESNALKAWSREIALARKISTFSPASLISAVDLMCENHPSQKVRELFRRVVMAAMTMSDVKDVVERVYDAIYSWFESKISNLTEYFTIIAGSSMLVYLLIPIIVFAIAPVLLGSISAILIITLSIQILVFFILYALIVNSYPTSFVIKSQGKQTYVFIASYLTVSVLLFYNIFSQLLRRSDLPVLNEALLVAVILGVITPSLIISEIQMKQVSLYDTFIGVASDSMSLAAVTGENVAQVLEEESRKYGKNIVKLTRSILMGYTSKILRRNLVSRAPSTYHASFIEGLIIILTLGSTPEMLRAFTSSYEKLQVLISNTRRLASRLESMIIGLAMLTGIFLSYLDKTYQYIFNLVHSIQLPGQAYVFNYDPSIYGLLNATTLLSLFLVSIFVGIIRGGSVNYSFRTTAMTLVVYMLSRTLFTSILVT